jgi:Holliday junction DNA helicase RuvB
MAQVKGESAITDQVLKDSLELLEVDDMGLDANDRRLLKIIINQHQGGPVGLETLAATLAEQTDTLEEVIEPYLLQIGFLKRSHRGRIATLKAFKHFNKKPPKAIQQKLI